MFRLTTGEGKVFVGLMYTDMVIRPEHRCMLTSKKDVVGRLVPRELNGLLKIIGKGILD